jgi:hypothetical protein
MTRCVRRSRYGAESLCKETLLHYYYFFKSSTQTIFQYNRHNFAGASREVEVQITTIVDEVLLIDVKDFSASLN